MATAAPSARLYYLDWLRVLAMFGVFIFHNARFYDSFSDWEVRNSTTDPGATVIVAFFSQFIMPIFFLISGAAVYYAFKSRTPGKFVWERFLRLFIPIVFGMLVVVVPQSYFYALSHGEVITGNVFQIYIQYLQTLPGLPWHHLWFLFYLFGFSIIALPLFVSWKQEGASILSKIARKITKPYIFLPFFILVLAAIEVFLYPGGFWGSRGLGNWSIVAYLFFFVLGYLIFADARIMEAVKKLRWALLGISLAAFAFVLVFLFDYTLDPQAGYGAGGYMVSQALLSIGTMCLMLSFLGLAARYLNKTNRFLTYANEAVLPFYILHQTIIIIIGYYVVQWNTSVAVKYLTIATTSFIAIMIIYEFLVRRWNILRFLFGMRWIKVPRSAEVKESQS